MSPYIANFLFESANFLLLAGGLGWALFKPIRTAIEGERTRHAAEREEVERLRAEAEALALEARKAQAAADGELEARRKAVVDQAKRDAAAILEDARATERAERDALHAELERTRQADVAALAESVGRLAARSVRKLLETLEGPSLDAALLGAAIAELEGMGRTRASALTLVESARPLIAEQRGQLRGVLGGSFEARVIPELGAGVRITTEAGQVDATAVSIARRAASVSGDLAGQGGLDD